MGWWAKEIASVILTGPKSTYSTACKVRATNVDHISLACWNDGEFRNDDVSMKKEMARLMPALARVYYVCDTMQTFVLKECSDIFTLIF